jgi:tetratricopeptide (TPR) repeat protein
LVHTGGEEEDPTNRRDALRLGLAFAAGALVPEAAPRLGAADVERLRAAVRALYALGAQHGGGAVFERAIGQLREVRRLLGIAAYGSATGRRLQVVAGELTEEAGLLAFDAGRQGTARRLFTEALALAELAESAQLKTLVLASMTIQAAEYGDARESADLAEAAQRAARPIRTSKLSSLLGAREALAYARQGDGARCGVALASAERLLDDGEDPEDPDWVAFWEPANLYETVARAHLLFGDPGRAAQAARSALDCTHPGRMRNEALTLASLAQALVGQGDLDEAVAVTSEAVDRVGTISSERCVTGSGRSGVPWRRGRRPPV